MKKALGLSIFLLAGFLLAGNGFAQQQSQQDQKMRSQQQQVQMQQQAGSGVQLPWAQKSSDVLDKKIVSRDGKELGTAEDLIIGKDGKIEYVILSTGGLLGIGEDKISVPWDKVRATPNVDQLIADVSQSEVQKYSEEKADKGGSRQTAQREQQASFMPFAQIESQRLREFMDQEVVGRDGEALGKVNDVFTDEQGRPMYVVVEGESERLHPVPAELLRANMEEKTISADFDKQAFQSSPGFDEAQISQQQQWEPKVRGYYEGGRAGQSGQRQPMGMDRQQPPPRMDQGRSQQPPPGMGQSGRQQPPPGMGETRQQSPPPGTGQSQNR